MLLWRQRRSGLWQEQIERRISLYLGTKAGTGRPFHGDEKAMGGNRMRMTMDVMDVVMRMRTAKGLQSQIRRFLSAPPQYSGSLQSQEKQERLSNMENVLKIRNHRVSFEKCPFLEIDTFQCKFYKGNI